MKKSDIKEGVVYRNKLGHAAREVVAIFVSKAEAESAAQYRSYGEEGPHVVYRQVRGPSAGSTAAAALSSFAAWAYSEDAGTPASVADLRQRIADLEAGLKPFAGISQTSPRLKGHLFTYGTATITFEDCRAAAKLLEKTP